LKSSTRQLISAIASDVSGISNRYAAGVKVLSREFREWDFALGLRSRGGTSGAAGQPMQIPRPTPNSPPPPKPRRPRLSIHHRWSRSLADYALRSQTPTARTALQGFDLRDGNLGLPVKELAEVGLGLEPTSKNEPFAALNSNPVARPQNRFCHYSANSPAWRGDCLTTGGRTTTLALDLRSPVSPRATTALSRIDGSDFQTSLFFI
jgi:hypothetical protein